MKAQDTTKKDMIVAAILNNYSYDVDTNTVTHNRLKKVVTGSPSTKDKYLRIGITYGKGKYTTVYFHRLVWVLVNKSMPVELHHLDNSPRNNSISNLECVTHRENITAQPSRSKTGYKGVGVNGKNYQARIMIDGKLTALGTFSCPVEAARTYDKEARRVHGSYAHLNFPN